MPSFVRLRLKVKIRFVGFCRGGIAGVLSGLKVNRIIKEFMNTANLSVDPLQKTAEKLPERKKRILILISEGGGGHKMAGDSLKAILSPEYDVEIVNVFRQIIQPLDLLHSLTSGRISGEDFYNFLLRRGYHRSANLYATIGNKYMHKNRSRIERLFDKYMSQLDQSYDLVISTVPFINLGIAAALQKKEIPFMIMPTDLDTATFFLGMSFLDPKKGGKFAFAIPYDDPDLKKKGLKNASIPLDDLVVTGFPVRVECQKKYSPDQVRLLKIKHGMLFDYTTLTLVLGAAGNRMLFTYAQELAKLSNSDFTRPVEVNVCVGRNEQVRLLILDWMLQEGAKVLHEAASYSSVCTSQGIVFHLRKFTKDIVELMACSDLVITKTGSCSVNEAIYLGKKLLLDNTENSSARYLFWETFNVPFVRKHGLGDAFYHLHELNCLIRVLLKEDLGHPVLSGHFPVPDFKQNVKTVVQSLFE